jgi:DNA replication protein DnaC
MGHSENFEAQAVVETCAKHGEFETRRKYIELLNKWIGGTCPKCSIEREDAEAAEQARLDGERNLAALRKAGVPLRFQGKTLETYQADNDKQQIAVAACRKLISAMQARSHAPNLIMIGKPGTGKSHLCCGIVLELYRTHRVRRVDLPDLIREIRATWHRDSEVSEERVLDWYGALDLLIIEEVGTGAGTDDERARIFQVINRRYEAMLPTVVVSNLDMAALKLEIGDRVIDRLREGDRSLVVFDWQSMRGAQ